MTWFAIFLCRTLVILLAMFGAAVIAAVVASKYIRRELHKVGIQCENLARIGEESDVRVAAVQAEVCKSEACQPCDDRAKLLEFQSRPMLHERQVAHAGQH